MNETSQYSTLLPIALAIIGLLAGFALGWLLRQVELVKLRAELDKQQALHGEKLATLEQANHQLKDSFAALSQSALKDNRDTFMQMAEQHLKHQQVLAQGEMDKRQQSIASMVDPIKEALNKTGQQLQSMEKERAASLGSLTQQLHAVAETQNLLQAETRNLVTALRRPEVRGQWGEITLKRLAELAGMVEYCDFTEQTSVRSEDGLLRPDMVVRMPDQRELIIDAKTPLDAYLSAVQADSDELRKQALQQHAGIVRKRVRELAQKKYWDQFENAPDYVVLFIPGDQFLAAALEVDSEIMEYALGNQVILATPTSLIALLRAVAFGWRQQAVAENAEKIQKLGEDLYNRVTVFSEHLSKMGASLGKTVDFFNKAVGSMDRNVLPGARKFIELGIEEKKKLNEPDPIETQPRNVEAAKEAR
ncbi:MAG: DNA recombination protein RmuC [Gammaproteobacteria bacterium]|nr:MAG: DNA recombination protein RmuC [Gammaproteobacteria bacterium]